MEIRTCGECAEWKVEYGLCDYALSPPQRGGRCQARNLLIRWASEEACSLVRERTDGE